LTSPSLPAYAPGLAYVQDPRNRVLDGGQDRTNPFATTRDDKAAIRPFAKLLWPSVSDEPTGCTCTTSSIVNHTNIDIQAMLVWLTLLLNDFLRLSILRRSQCV